MKRIVPGWEDLGSKASSGKPGSKASGGRNGDASRGSKRRVRSRVGGGAETSEPSGTKRQ
jgi:hypothetical protein